MPISHIEQLCKKNKLRMTKQRRVIARVLSESHDHPDIKAVYQRVSQINPKISLATVYRTLRLLEEANILSRHKFADELSRYENAMRDHHYHLIDTQTGKIIEFHDERIESLQQEIAKNLGFELVGHRLELYGIPLKKSRK